ncbi:tetratricopeptide repeat protein [Bacteroidota bacterium]
MKISISIILLLFCSYVTSFTQGFSNEIIDSLKIELKATKEDTSKVYMLLAIAGTLKRNNPNESYLYAEKAFSLANKINYKSGLADVFNTYGSIYEKQGLYDKALKFYFKSLRLNKELKNQKGLANNSNGIGIVYWKLKEYDKALDYYNKALTINQQNNNKLYISPTLGNIGLVFGDLENFDKALEYYFRALKIDKELDNKDGIGRHLGNIGLVYSDIKDYDKALDYYTKSIKITRAMNDKTSTAINLINIGELYYEKGDYDKAIKYLNKSLSIFIENNYADGVIEAYEYLNKVYDKLGDKSKAYEYYKKYVAIKDSVFSQESQNKIIALEFQQERELKDKEIEIQKLEIERQEIINYFAIAGITLIALLAFFIYTRFRIKKKSNIEISRQKEYVERAYRNVKMLSEIGQNITTNLTVKKIIETVYDNVSLLMNSTVFGIGVYNSEDNRLDFIGSKELGETLPDFHFDLKEENRLAVLCFNKQNEIMISDYRDEITNYFPAISPPKAGKDTESLLYLPLNTKEKRIGVITIQSFEKNIYTEYHLDILRNLSIYVAIALDNAEAYKQIEDQKGDIEEKNTVLQKQSKEISTNNERLIELNNSKDRYLSLLKSELKLAADYVESLIPSSIEEGIVTTRWLYIPTAEVGGDSLGYHWLDDNNFAFYLVDVSGHGVGPALHTVSIMNSIKNETLPDVDFRLPEEVLSALNETFKMKEYNNIYFTMWYGVYNKKKRTLTYSGAGHPPAYFIHGRKTSLLESTNIVVGFKSGIQYKSSTVKIDDPSTIYIYSDGVYEIRKKDGEFWNSKEMYSFLSKENASEKGSDLESLYNYVREISGKDVLDDDFSILKLVIE